MREPGSPTLSWEAAAMGGRLGRLLAGLSEQPGPFADSAAFLADMANRTPEPSVEHEPPLERLVRGLGLGALERDLLLLGGLPEEHEGYADVLRTLHPRHVPRPTVALAAQVLRLDQAGRHGLRGLLAEGAAVRHGALRLEDPDVPWPDRSLSLTPGLWDALHGAGRWPLEEEPVPVAAGAVGLESWLERPDCQRVVEVLVDHTPMVVLLTAHRLDVAMARAVALAEAAGVAWTVRRWPDRAAPDLAAALVLHALVHGVVPVVVMEPSGEGGGTWLPDFPALPVPVVVCARGSTVAAAGRRPVLVLEAPRLRPRERVAMWARLAPELADQAPALAARYAVEAPLAAAAVADARAAGGPLSPEVLGRCVRERTRSAVSAAVQLIRPMAGFNRLVLPPDALAQLREAVARLEGQPQVLDDWAFAPDRRGARGVRMLFAGPPGTGKSLAAEVLAHTLGVHLLVVDVSRVVSKWLGETEKNLAAVFDAAEQTTAVLLFDEADALFGKRTEVKDAHDRYANLETAYLLARLESFEGLAVLSTNLRKNIDQAFLRRLEFVIEFAEPDKEERERLWRMHVAADAPLDEDVSFERLARAYPVPGGLIKNACLAAAFLAASTQETIGHEHFVRAMSREYGKVGRAFPGT